MQQFIGTKGKSPHKGCRQNGHNIDLHDIHPGAQILADKQLIADKDHQRIEYAYQRQRIDPQIREIQQKQQHQRLHRQCNAGRYQRHIHTTDGLQYRIGNGGHRIKNNRHCQQRQQNRSLVNRGLLGKEQHGNGLRQHRHAHCTGHCDDHGDPGDIHIPSPGILIIPLGIGGGNSRNDRGSQRRGHGNGNIGQHHRFSGKNAVLGGHSHLIQSLGVHQSLNIDRLI